MASSTEHTTQQSTQSTQTSPPASHPPPTPNSKPRRTPQQIRQSNASTALSCLLGLFFFTLIIHACVRSITNSKPQRSNDNDAAILGAVFSFIPVTFTIIGIVMSLEEVSTGLAGQTTLVAMFVAVVGLAWVVFGVGSEARFALYLAWVMWPVVGTFGVMVLGAWGWVAGVIEVVGDEGEAKDRKGEKKEYNFFTGVFV